MWKLEKRGIALLITVLFVMAITVAIGIGLKQVKEASWHVENENFMLQTSTTLEDVLNILKTSKELDMIVQEKSVEGFFAFLSSVSFIPFENSGMKVSIKINSARKKFNPNSLIENNNTANIATTNALTQYMLSNNIRAEYVNILLDTMGGIKEDMSYNSAIFNEKPSLFRDFITSSKHLNEVNDFYMQSYHDNSLKNINFENLFYFTKDKSSKIDLNYATSQTWQMMLGCDISRAEQLTLGGGGYTLLESLDLSEEEKKALSMFKTSYFEPYLDVSVEISQNSQNAKIEFEYDMSTKKGSNFVYEI
ncbi:MAG: hypothetical protein WC656_06075 [Sulfurimonas sp.]